MAPSERLVSPVTQVIGWEAVQACIDRRRSASAGTLGSEWSTSRLILSLSLIRYWYGERTSQWPEYVRAGIRASVRRAIDVLRFRPLGGQAA